MPINEYDELLADLDEEQQQKPKPKPAPTAPPSYDEFLQQSRDTLINQVSASMRQGAKTDPAKRLEAISMSSRFRVPVDVIERQFDYYKTLAASEPEDGNEYDDLFRRAPKLVEWLRAEPVVAPVAQKDLNKLAQVERSISFGGAILNGIDTIQRSVGRTLEAVGENVGLEGLAKYGRHVAEWNELQAAARGKKTSVFEIDSPATFGQWMTENIGEQIPVTGSIMGGAAAGAVVGSVFPVVGTTVGAIIGAAIPAVTMGIGEVQGQVKALDPDATAPLAVFIGGSAIGALDSVLPVKLGGMLVRTFGKEAAEDIALKALATQVKPKFLKMTAKGIVSGMSVEGLTEAVQEAVGQVAASQGAGVELDVRAAWRQMIEAAAAGASVGGVSQGTTTATTFRQQRQRYDALQQQKHFFDALADGAKDSELLKTLPPAFQDVVGKMTEGGPVENVFIDTEPFKRYWQSKNISPDLVAQELTGKPNALAEASDAGTPLTIPTAAYATKLAATDHHPFFAQELRMRPDEPNVREAKEAAAALSADAEAVATAVTAAAQKTEPVEATMSPIRTALATQILADPGFHEMVARERVDPLEVANIYAASMETSLTQLAKKAGEDPLDYIAKLNLTIGPGGTNEAIRALQAARPTATADGPLETPSALPDDPREPLTFFQTVMDRLKRLHGTIPGLKKVTPNLLPEERDALRSDSARRMLAQFAELPPDQDYMDAALAGVAKRGWYEQSARAIAEVFGADAPRFAGLLAALSPRTSVEANLLNAVTMWKNWTAAGRPTDAQAIAAILKDSVQQSEGKDSALPSWVPNTITALSTEDDSKIRLSGDKVNPFMLNLLGYSQQVTTDAWMAVFAGTLHAVLGGGISTSEHRAFAAKVRQVAKKLSSVTGEDWTPAEVQETVWSWTKTLYELAESEGKTAEEIVASGAISDEAITSTPDFAQLLTQQAPVREILEAAGYGDVITALDDTLNTGDGRGSAEASGRAGGSASRQDQTITPGLLRSARRLDDVRNKRRAISVTPYTEFVSRLNLADGVFTYNVIEKVQPVSGFALSIYPDRGVVFPSANHMTPQDLARFVAHNADLLLSGDGNNVGGWHNPETGHIALDVSRVVKSRKQAEHLGRLHEQEAFYDLKAGKSVPVVYPAGWVHGATWQGPGGPGAVVNEAGESVAPGRDAQDAAGAGTLPATDGTQRDTKRSKGRRADPGASQGANTDAGTDARAADGSEQLRRSHDPPQPGVGRPAQPSVAIQTLAAAFMAARGISTKPTYDYAVADHVELATVADAYDAQPIDASANADVRQAYEAFGREVQAQWDYLIQSGLELLPWRNEGQPYANSAEMAADVQQNKRLFFFTGGEDHPFLGERTRDDQGLTLNDKFRAVHDVFGHVAGGYGFGYRGEENAWRAHSQMFSPDARRAMTTETRGQNAWTNFGRQNYNADGSYKNIPAAERPYAAQKVVLLPDRFVFGESPRTLYQSPTTPSVAQWAYSRLTKAVEAAKVEKAKGREWKAIIKGAKIGVNQDEYELVHVGDLDDATTYTREDVLSYLRVNKVPIYVHVMSQYPAAADIDAETEKRFEVRVQAAIAREENFGNGPFVVGPDITLNREDGTYAVEGDEFETSDEAEARAAEIRDQWEDEANAQFAQQVRDSVPWERVRHEVERELRDDLREDGKMAVFGSEDYVVGGAIEPESYRDVFILAPGVSEDGHQRVMWRDGHEDYDHNAIENPIVRLRFDIRKAVVTGATRGRVIGEPLASGRVPVFVEGERIHQQSFATRELAEADVAKAPTFTERSKSRVMFLEEIQPPQQANFDLMPALFQKQWREIGMKWALRYAAENNLDGVAWTTGDQQRERYRLDSVIDGVLWEPPLHYPEARTRVVIKTRTAEDRRGTLRLDVERETGIVMSNSDDFVGEKFADVIGADAAEKILASSSGEMAVEDIPHGGAGLNRLYDVDLPIVVNKLPAVKKNGGKVTTVEVAVTADRDLMDQPAVLLTPEMRQAIMGGQALFQDNADDHIGSITFSSRGVQINFLQDANLSTFLHETGHLYLQALADLADKVQRGDPATWSASQISLVEDRKTIWKWLGAADGAELTDAQHEQFARGYELYLMRGIAPSRDLKPAFQRFRTWLTKIYKSMALLNVEINDEIVAVFDRLSASEDAINAARQEARIAPMVSTAEQIGMSQIEWQGYHRILASANEEAKDVLERRLMRELQREREAWWKTQRAAVLKEVEAELREMPAYRALLFLQRGEAPDGTPIPDAAKLSKDSIVERYGKDRLAALPKPWVYTTDGGIDVDAAADLLGFKSGDELLTAIAGAERIAALAIRETETRMQTRYGNMRLDGTIRQAARAAVTNDSYDAVLEAELRAIAKASKMAAPIVRAAKAQEAAEEASARRSMRRALSAAVAPAEAVRATAEDRIAKIPAKDIKPHLYWMAARTESAASSSALADGRFEDAVVAKKKQRLAVALHRAAVEALDEVDGIQKFAKRLGEQPAQARLGKAGESYQAQVNALLNKFEFQKISNKALDRRATLLEWVQDRQQEGYQVELPAEVLEAAQQINFMSVPMERLREVRDALKHIEALARLKDELLTSKDKRDYEAKRDGLVTSLREKNTPRPRKLEYRGGDVKRYDIATFFASHAKISELAQQLDGYVDGGPMWNLIVRPLNAAADVEVQRRQREGERYNEILKKHYPGKQIARLREMVRIDAIDDSLSREAILAIALNWGNETSRDRILSDPKRKFSRHQVESILGTMDRRDWDFVVDTWRFVDSFWAEISDKTFRVTGLRPEKVDGVQVDTKFGTFKGGYYPLAYDGRLSSGAGTNDIVSQAKLQLNAAYLSQTTKRGHLKSRLEHVELAVKLELGVLFNHIDQVVHDLTHHEALIDVTRLLRDRKVSQAVTDVAGDQVFRQFSDAVTAIAVGTRGDAASRIARFVKTGTQVSALGMNLWTFIQQFSGMSNGAARVGPVWVLRGALRFLRDATTMENTAAWIYRVSPFMAGRGITQTQDINDLRNKLAQPGGWFDAAVRRMSRETRTQQDILDAFLWHIGQAQKVADIPTWLGQYEKSRHEGKTEEDAIALADQAVKDSQGSGLTVDLAGVQRGNEWAKLFMVFYSYGSTVYNQTHRAFGRVSAKPIHIARFISDLSLIYFFPAVFTQMLARLVGKSGDEDDDVFDVSVDLFKEMGASALNTMIGIRELGGMLRMANRGYQGPAGTRIVQNIYALGYQASQVEVDEPLLKALNQTAGILFRYPAVQVERSLEGFIEIYEGRTTDPLVLAFGPRKDAK